MATIDENLYSRQLYAIGFEAMKKMATSSVLISGMNGLGVEIAKNAILQGFKTVTLHDTNLTTNYDLSTNYYLTEKDIGKNRAEISYNKLSELNNYVKVTFTTEQLSNDLIKQYSAIVLVDYDLNDQLPINDFTHQNNIKFISCSTFGLVGQIFCDYGPGFVVVDQDGEQPNVSIVENITNENNPLVTCIESKPHGLLSGDHIKFTNVQGMPEICNHEALEIQYVDNVSFKLNIDTTNYGKYDKGEMTQVKISKEYNFKSLKESLDAPEFVLTDFTDFEKPNKLHAMIQCLKYDDYDEFVTKVRKLHNDISDDLLSKFHLTHKGKLTPVNSVIGGIVAQEILKACSGKFTPIYQWLYFDSLDCLPENYKDLDRKMLGSRYDGQIAVFGEKIQNLLGNAKYFVVGSGAIGCELLKNFAMIGLSANSGKIYVTDMDTIEKSNLNRQFLFRNQDIGKPKSEVAAKAVKEMNPKINIEAHVNKMGIETESYYDMQFFNSLSGIANALDNVQARLYMDSRCVLFKKSLIESGTLGTKGNVQTIVPHMTESYGSSVDPPEASIPVCTIKTFPNQIEHCVQWCREQFEDLFVQKPKHTMEYLKNPDGVHEMTPSDALGFIENVNFTLKHVPENYNDCLEFGYDLFHEFYVKQIDQLLSKFPHDYRTSTDTPFWSGAKKCPHSLKFDSHDENHLNYVKYAGNLWAKMFNINIVDDTDYVREMCNLFVPDLETNKDVEISINDEEEKKRIEEKIKAVDIDELIKTLPNVNTLGKLQITPHDFEKDDDTNYHIDFMTSSSNLRAINYDINIASRHTIKGIAGKIIPALATTTSVVAGLVTLELYKLIQGFDKLENYRNTFLNLALPYFGFSEPMKTKKSKIGDKEYSMWDTFIVKASMTLKEFLDMFQNDHGIDIDTVTFGNAMLYSMLLNPKKMQARMNMTIKEIIENDFATKVTGAITLGICTLDEDTLLPDVLCM